MKILTINNFNISQLKPLSFKATKPNPYENVPHNDEFVRSTGSLDIARLKNLGIKHFRLIDSNSVRGVTLANQRPSLLSDLKECGINTIIDLRSEGGELKVKMPIFNVPNATKLSIDERHKQNKEFVDNLPKFFEKMNSGKYYMACLLGLHRTDLAVTLNYLVNPKEPVTPPTLSHMFMKEETNLTNKYIGAIKNLIKNLSPKDREFLNLPENFNEIFSSRILKLRLMNCAK